MLTHLPPPFDEARALPAAMRVDPVSTVQIPEPVRAAVGRDGLYGEDWVRNQPGSHFTIQIAATREYEAVRQYALGLPPIGHGDLALVRMRSGAETWHGLVKGSYPDAQKAHAAMAQLPVSMRQSDPWVRSFASIQRAMSPLPQL
jgi:DamX protein